ncbi:MAG TPA: alpha/beta hydrolase [Pseudonocardiaceae bacterium]|nr:alpha/beta hydrolase [Pseudonocardiaceae bacterium]
MTSTGGIIARQYAARHPEGLAGLVLVDSSHEDQIRRLAPAKPRRDRVDLWRRSIVCLVTPLGVVRAAEALGLRERRADAAGVMAQAARTRRADAQEMINHALTVPGTKPPDLGDLPLLVITAGAADRGEAWPVWRQMQAELAGLSTRSTHVMIGGVGHHINRDDPDALIEQIREAIERFP